MNGDTLDTAWMDDAACTPYPTSWWFTDPQKPGDAETAVSICLHCPVQSECLDFALRSGERDGIWGGFSAKKRGRLRATLHSIGAVRVRRLCETCAVLFIVDSLNSPAQFCDDCAEEQTRQLDRLRERRAG